MLAVGVEDVGHVGAGQVGVPDDAVRESALVGDVLQPARLPHRVARVPADVEVHGLDEVLALGVAQEVVDRVIAQQRVVAAPRGGADLVAEPRVVVRIEIPQVLVGIDDRDVVRAHRQLLTELRRTTAQDGSGSSAMPTMEMLTVGCQHSTLSPRCGGRSR
nr:hypothetical protein [Saccharopolyspora flava]